jgi:hypothetical protein
VSEVELILRERMRQQSFDRYERRALSRRKSAARGFDTAFLEAVRTRGFPAIWGAGDVVEDRSSRGHATRFKTKRGSETKTTPDQVSEPDAQERKP